ncbi:MAG: LPS export ABC transporter periplasmic protein LptC [Verrucomicrobiota bacterium]
MRSLRPLFLLLVAGTALASTTRIATDKPIVNFRLPDFTPEGHRSWLVRGTEARYAADGLVDIRELNLTVFTGRADDKVETLILSPAARVRLKDRQVSGPDSIRIINDRFEASGSDWSYDHAEKKVSIAKNVRVILHTRLNDILK